MTVFANISVIEYFKKPMFFIGVVGIVVFVSTLRGYYFLEKLPEKIKNTTFFKELPEKIKNS